MSADEILADDAVLARVEADLAGVERAMARLDDGTYEACEVCGQPIGDERLSTAPTETRCSTSRADRGRPWPAKWQRRRSPEVSSLPASLPALLSPTLTAAVACSGPRESGG